MRKKHTQLHLMRMFSPCVGQKLAFADSEFFRPRRPSVIDPSQDVLASGVLARTVGVSWCGSAFAPFERRSAFNSFECGNVPYLHLAMEPVGYVAVEINPGRDGIRQGPHP